MAIKDGTYAVTWDGRLYLVEQMQDGKWIPIKSARSEKEADEIKERLEAETR